jgi:hypothetical protein
MSAARVRAWAAAKARHLRMMLAATAFCFGKDNIGIVNSTGCSTVYASDVSLQSVSRVVDELALRERARRCDGHPRPLGSDGLEGQKLWVIGGDGAMLDIGFPKLEPHVGQRHEHQGARARHAGLLQHRRAILHRHVPGQNTKFSPFTAEDSRQERGAQGIAQIA